MSCRAGALLAFLFVARCEAAQWLTGCPRSRRVSNVDITSRSCELNFGVRKRTLTGREANEIFATAAAAGIAAEGAAGSSIESISKLRCTLDPNEIMQKAGGGAECSYETGQ